MTLLLKAWCRSTPTFSMFFWERWVTATFRSNPTDAENITFPCFWALKHAQVKDWHHSHQQLVTVATAFVGSSPVTLDLLLWPCRTLLWTKSLFVLRGSWSCPTCFMASTRTQWWRTGPSTTSLWRTSSLLSSTSHFASFASWSGQRGSNKFGVFVRCTLWNNSTLNGFSHTPTHRLGSAARVAVATGGRTGANYSMMVFASWDYGSLGDKETRLKQKNILYRLQVRRSCPPPQPAAPLRVSYWSHSCLPVRWTWRRSS